MNAEQLTKGNELEKSKKAAIENREKVQRILDAVKTREQNGDKMFQLQRYYDGQTTTLSLSITETKNFLTIQLLTIDSELEAIDKEFSSL